MKTSAFLAVLTLVVSAHAYETKISKGQLSPTLDAMLEKAPTFQAKIISVLSMRLTFIYQMNSTMKAKPTVVR
jgi:hypothetical protein